jgi:hypothetical protein
LLRSPRLPPPALGAVVCVILGTSLAACNPPPGEVASDAGSMFPWEDAAPPALDATGGDGAPADGAIGDAGVPDGGSDGAPPSEGGVPPTPYSVVVLPDTQYYASNYPEIFDQQAEWIVSERVAGNVAFVLTEGDIVDTDAPDQWMRASHSLHMLDGLVPYVVVAGNHDYAGGGWVSDRSTMIDDYFPPSTFTPYPWFKGTFEPGRIENNYTLFDVPGGGGQWLVLSLEFGPRDEVLAWADGILKQYPTTPAMIVTHAYLYSDDHRYDNVLYPEQLWSPYDYPIGAGPPGTVNDGEQMWQKLVRPNSNVRFVLSGHVLNDGVGRLTSTRDDGTTVHQLLANYQVYDAGGDGYLRVMQFFPAERLVHVRTYSPYVGAFMTDADNDFVLAY